jgi:AraC-like DNA-binding protein
MKETVSAGLVRHVMSGAGSRGADARILAREAGLPVWALSDDDTRFPVTQLARLWQVSVEKLADPRLGIHVADRWTLGMCHLTDYLFDTAATLGAAISLTLDYTPLLNTGQVNDIGLDDTDCGSTVRYQVRSPDPVVNAAATKCALATIMQRAWHATGRPVAPVHVGLAIDAPRTHNELADAFGTARVDFGVHVSTITFSRADLDLPLLRADPVLAAILRAQADAAVAAPARPPLWIERFRQVLAECVNDRELLLASAARRLMVSPRTLQRLLEQEGTSWRAEVDAARRARAGALLADGLSKTRAATRLGYSDARALRRAMRRWSQP